MPPDTAKTEISVSFGGETATGIDAVTLAGVLADFARIGETCAPGSPAKVAELVLAVRRALGFEAGYLSCSDVAWSVLDGAAPSCDGDVQQPGQARAIEVPVFVNGETFGVLNLDGRPAARGPLDRLEREVVRLGTGLIGQDIALGQALKRLSGAQHLLEIEAATDFQTGLMNRRVFLKNLDKVCEHSRRYQSSFALMRLDIDQFTAVQRRYSEDLAAGLLAACAQRLVDALRKSDVIGRFGPHGFAVILPETPEDEACRAAEKSLDCMRAAPFDLGGSRESITLSVGVTYWRAQNDDPSSLLARADRALQHARQKGRDRCYVI